MTTAEDQRIEAVTADSPFARFDAAVEARLKLFFSPATPVFTPRTRHYGERLLGVPCKTIAQEDAMATIAPPPILLIQGGKDHLVTPDNAHGIYQQSPENITNREVPEASHIRSIYLARAEYALRINEFLQASFSTREAFSEEPSALPTNE